MVCRVEPKHWNKRRLEVKLMIEKRLTYRKEVLLADEIPPIPNVRRTRRQLSRSPVYQRTKTMIPTRLNKMLATKQNFRRRNQIDENEDDIDFTVSSAYTDSNHDFGFYNKPKRKKSTTISDLTEKLRDTRRLLDILKESETKSMIPRKSARRKLEIVADRICPERGEPKITDFISASTASLECASIEPSESPRSRLEVLKMNYNNKKQERITPPKPPSTLIREEFSRTKQLQGRRGTLDRSGEIKEAVAGQPRQRSEDRNTMSGISDPFTDSDFMGGDLYEEMVNVAEFESDEFSMCSENITHLEARDLLTRSEKRFSLILNNYETKESEDSFLENERMTEMQVRELEVCSVEDVRFMDDDLPLLERSSGTESTLTVDSECPVMMPSREDLKVKHSSRPAQKFSAGNKDARLVVQPKPIKKLPSTTATRPDYFKSDPVDFDDYEKDLNDIENILAKYDNYRKETKKNSKEKDVAEPKNVLQDTKIPVSRTKPEAIKRRISDGVLTKPKLKRSIPVSSINKIATTRKDIKTGIASGITTKSSKTLLIQSNKISLQKQDSGTTNRGIPQQKRPPTAPKALEIPKPVAKKTIASTAKKSTTASATKDEPTQNKTNTGQSKDKPKTSYPTKIAKILPPKPTTKPSISPPTKLTQLKSSNRTSSTIASSEKKPAVSSVSKPPTQPKLKKQTSIDIPSSKDQLTLLSKASTKPSTKSPPKPSPPKGKTSSLSSPVKSPTKVSPRSQTKKPDVPQAKDVVKEPVDDGAVKFTVHVSPEATSKRSPKTLPKPVVSKISPSKKTERDSKAPNKSSSTTPKADVGEPKPVSDIPKPKVSPKPSLISPKRTAISFPSTGPGAKQTRRVSLGSTSSPPKRVGASTTLNVTPTTSKPSSKDKTPEGIPSKKYQTKSIDSGISPPIVNVDIASTSPKPTRRTSLGSPHKNIASTPPASKSSKNQPTIAAGISPPKVKSSSGDVAARRQSVGSTPSPSKKIAGNPTKPSTTKQTTPETQSAKSIATGISPPKVKSPVRIQNQNSNPSPPKQTTLKTSTPTSKTSPPKPVDIALKSSKTSKSPPKPERSPKKIDSNATPDATKPPSPPKATAAVPPKSQTVKRTPSTLSLTSSPTKPSSSAMSPKKIETKTSVTNSSSVKSSNPSASSSNPKSIVKSSSVKDKVKAVEEVALIKPERQLSSSGKTDSNKVAKVAVTGSKKPLSVTAARTIPKPNVVPKTK